MAKKNGTAYAESTNCVDDEQSPKKEATPTPQQQAPHTTSQYIPEEDRVLFIDDDEEQERRAAATHTSTQPQDLLQHGHRLHGHSWQEAQAQRNTQSPKGGIVESSRTNATTQFPLEANTLMSELHHSMEQPMAWTIMIVDDEPEVHQVTKLALQRFTYGSRGLNFISAYSAKEAESYIVQYPDVAVILLDVVMETNQAGLDFVHYLRKRINNQRTRVILRTGQPGEAPEEAIIREYDINDYKTKTELTRQKLCTTILVSLRTYEQIVAFEKNQRELQELSQRLRERNVELQQAKDVAEAASRAKDEFLSLMNHELRTPLNVILMRAEILDNGVHGHLSVKQKNSLELIRNSGHHLLSIIDDILDLAGIETGKLAITRRPISANDACFQSVELIQDVATAKQISVDLVLAPEPLWIYADERRLVQILEKLLRNAVKFTKECGTVGLKLGTDAEAGMTQITVWDEGIGIASMDIARLFQPFVQLEHSLTRRFEGAGLGLSIASKLTTLMGGTISVESQPGQGSRFTVKLPIATQASPN